jgi:hypothetical protein
MMLLLSDPYHFTWKIQGGKNKLCLNMSDHTMSNGIHEGVTYLRKVLRGSALLNGRLHECGLLGGVDSRESNVQDSTQETIF